MRARLACGLIVLIAVGVLTQACVNDKPTDKPAGGRSAAPVSTAVAEETSSSTPERKTDATCLLVAKRFIQRSWKCDLNMSGITPEHLCAGDNRQKTSSMRYLASIETCNEFRSRILNSAGQ